MLASLAKLALGIVRAGYQYTLDDRTYFNRYFDWNDYAEVRFAKGDKVRFAKGDRSKASSKSHKRRE